jgi:hypothetical protein
MSSGDIFATYELCLQRLTAELAPSDPEYREVQVLRQRLLENIHFLKRHGDTEQRRADRSAIYDRLNEIALDTLGTAFLDLAKAPLGQASPMSNALPPRPTSDVSSRSAERPGVAPQNSALSGPTPPRAHREPVIYYAQDEYTDRQAVYERLQTHPDVRKSTPRQHRVPQLLLFLIALISAFVLIVMYSLPDRPMIARPQDITLFDSTTLGDSTVVTRQWRATTTTNLYERADVQSAVLQQIEVGTVIRVGTTAEPPINGVPWRYVLLGDGTTGYVDLSAFEIVDP